MKKIALFLALVLTLSFVSSFAVSAAETIQVTYEVLQETPERTIGLDCYAANENTSAEILEDGGKKVYGWGWTSHKGRDNTYLGCGFVDMSSDAHSGEKAVHVNLTDGQHLYVGPGVTIIPGQTYEITFWYKRLKEGGSAIVHFLFSGKDKGVAQTYTRPKLTLASEVKDGWVQKTMRFVAPQFATSVSAQVRFTGPGEFLLDDISALCITNEMPKPKMPEKLPAIKKLITEDPGFESGTVGAEIHTIPQWDETIGDAKISDQYAHTGTKSVELKTEDGSKDAIGIMYLKGMEEGATYQISTWLMNPSELKIDMGYWMHWCSSEEYNSNTETQLESSKPRWSVRTSFQWQEYVAEFVAPQGAKSAMLYFRHRLCPGSIFMDDVEINMVKPPNAVKADTDEVFYYTEWDKGYVEVTPTYVMDPANTTATFTFQGLGGETLDQKSFTGITEEFSYEFPTSLMAQKGQQYNINMKITDASGTVIQEQNFPVHRYDRPLYLGADGIFRKNGKEIPVSMGSGMNMNKIDKNAEKTGVTIVQLNADNPKLGFTQEERLNAFYERGMFVLLNCYSGSKSGGHPDQIDQVKRMAETYKDNPAFFGYKLIDEPYQKGISAEELMAGYKAIRDIDPYHPIYIDDSPVGSYDFLFKFCDIFECDYYGGSGADGGRKITEVMDVVQKASKGRKPYNVLLQFADYNYMPSYEDLQHMRYQAFFSGAYGYSYHTFGSDSNMAGVDRPEFKELIDKWAPWEKDFAWGCFVTGTYKFVNYQKTDDVLWGTFADDKDVYAIVLNRDKSKSVTAEVPLKDGAGLVNIGAFTATQMDGDAAPITGNGTLSVELKPFEAMVWKITPTEAVDFSVLKNSKFNDVINYPWAYNAIATLEEKGIVNKVSDQWYGPERNITRGDYAMFLVRTLGLTDGAGENFVDVDPNAEYAKELAIGKAAGIINGVGDNKFNPTAQITRQDMMTMTSRALKLAGSADLGSFSDSGIIADYASAHVSAMVAEGLIKGNADGTINPLGNTTRAEAAVIMQRLLNK
ncbi:MAG: S-layer homology domain-containing protein [Clostridia bacterium]|nr:S-layer homology domain-containing protein [Clostridia bacterium]